MICFKEKGLKKMGVVSGIVVYICIWWMVLFCTLPIGVTPHQEEGMGTAGSAPQAPNLKFKFLLTTGISAAIWVIVFIIMQMELISFLEIAEEMRAEDIRNEE